MKHSIARRVAVAGVFVVALSSQVAAHAAGPRCAGSAPGGDWRLYGHDAANSRRQPAES
ncbi:MAG: hypothetical protein QOF27_1537, partial [Gaiellaceae bacterium]|nr:hypothetical protein [Gaiellaceae bacterium]